MEEGEGGRAGMCRAKGVLLREWQVQGIVASQTSWEGACCRGGGPDRPLAILGPWSKVS